MNHSAWVKVTQLVRVDFLFMSSRDQTQVVRHKCFNTLRAVFLFLVHFCVRQGFIWRRLDSTPGSPDSTSQVLRLICLSPSLMFDPWKPHGGRREPIPTSHSLTSTCVPWHMFKNTWRKNKMKLCTVAHTFNPNSWEAGGSLEFKKGHSSLQRLLEQLGLHRDPASNK